MHDVIGYLKNAVTKDITAGVASCYIIRDGAIYARNMTMCAGIEFQSEASFSVPAAALDTALSRMQEVKEMTVDKDSITVKGGRLRTTIRCNHDEPPPIPMMPDDWLNSPPGLARALELAIPFLGEMSWSAGICLTNDRVIGMCNTQGIMVDVKGLKLDDCLITKDVAEFIIAQGDPDFYWQEQNAVLFRWQDGRWLRAQLLTDAMPLIKIDKVFELAAEKVKMIPITEEWRAAYADASALAEDHVIMTPINFRAVKGAAETEVVFDTPLKLPKEHESYWTTKVVDAALACATAWNPVAWPQPTLFTAPGLKGVVMGRAKR